MGCTSTTAYLTIHNMVSWMLGSWLPAAVAEEWVPRLASGELLGSYCLTEPGAGSDAAARQSTAPSMARTRFTPAPPPCAPRPSAGDGR